MAAKKTSTRASAGPVERYADMFAALGTDRRLQILRFLLSAHPDGMVVGDIQTEIGIPPSTLSHHLDRLKAEGLVKVQRESTYLRYFANTAVLEELLGFLLAECCQRSKAVNAQTVIQICGIRTKGKCS